MKKFKILSTIKTKLYNVFFAKSLWIINNQFKHLVLFMVLMVLIIKKKIRWNSVIIILMSFVHYGNINDFIID